MTPEEYNQLYQLGTALAGDSFLYGVRLPLISTWNSA
jgi:hypothetical protein